VTHTVSRARRLAKKAEHLAGQIRDRARARLGKRKPSVSLDTVQRRLELVVAALYGRPIALAATDRPPNTFRARLESLLGVQADARRTTPTVDGETIRLPETLDAPDGAERAIARYRILAIEQAERIARGTPARVPSADPLERDLYLLREGVAIDAALMRRHPGLADALNAERATALARRPMLTSLSAQEMKVELMLRDALGEKGHANDPLSAERGPDGDHSPNDSLSWAREAAARIRPLGGRYRGLPPTMHWGTVKATEIIRESDNPFDRAPQHLPIAGSDAAPNRRSGAIDNAEERKTNDESDSQGKAFDPAAPPDAELSDEASAFDPRARPDLDRRALWGTDAFERTREQLATIDPDELRDLPPVVAVQDEWDSAAGRYDKRAALVRLDAPVEGDGGWAAEVLARHGALVRTIRHHFERLRARRMLLGRQFAGDELDVAAWVDAVVDRRTGDAPDDRLYRDTRPARRGLAISLLVDVSGSTETLVSDGLRIVDLERVALLLASEALDALGDSFAVHTFSGKTAADVRVRRIKDFSEPSSDRVRRRIAGIEPGGFTRLGAAVRFASRHLARRSAGHRLLLILSDGRPNDVDRYQGSHGVEDARQAILEARGSGIFPFCLTVDADASEYLPRIFGPAGHRMVQWPSQLPSALLAVVSALVRRR
jgi:nitric oxide reductase NorD protein